MYKLSVMLCLVLSLFLIGCATAPAPKPVVKKVTLTPDQAAQCKKDCFDDRVACYNRAELAWKCEDIHASCMVACTPN